MARDACRKLAAAAGRRRARRGGVRAAVRRRKCEPELGCSDWPADSTEATCATQGTQLRHQNSLTDEDGDTQLEEADGGGGGSPARASRRCRGRRRTHVAPVASTRPGEAPKQLRDDQRATAWRLQGAVTLGFRGRGRTGAWWRLGLRVRSRGGATAAYKGRGRALACGPHLGRHVWGGDGRRRRVRVGDDGR
jgi:hypothetical protein